MLRVDDGGGGSAFRVASSLMHMALLVLAVRGVHRGVRRGVDDRARCRRYPRLARHDVRKWRRAARASCPRRGTRAGADRDPNNRVASGRRRPVVGGLLLAFGLGCPNPERPDHAAQQLLSTQSRLAAGPSERERRHHRPRRRGPVSWTAREDATGAAGVSPASHGAYDRAHHPHRRRKCRLGKHRPDRVRAHRTHPRTPRHLYRQPDHHQAAPNQQEFTAPIVLGMYEAAAGFSRGAFP